MLRATVLRARSMVASGAGTSPVDGEVDPVLVAAVAASAIGVDVHRHGANRAGLQAVAVLLIVFLDEDRIVRDAAALPVPNPVCAARSKRHFRPCGISFLS